MNWMTERGPREVGVGALIRQDIHLVISCHRCHRDVRYTPKEAAFLLGEDCSLIEARDRLRCSWCRARGRQHIDARPCTLDRSAAHHLERAESLLRLWPTDKHAQAGVAEARAAWVARRPYDTDDFLCEAYRLTTPIAQISAEMRALGLPLLFPGDATPNDWPDVAATRPADMLPVFRPADAGEPTAGLNVPSLRWWLVPYFHRGPIAEWKTPSINAPAEILSTSRTFKAAFERRRCLAPADAFYIWRGPDEDRRRWRIERPTGEWWCFAGLWDRAETASGIVESFAIVTAAGGPDICSYADRQPVILAPEHYARWLDLSADTSPLLRPSPAGSLVVGAEEPQS